MSTLAADGPTNSTSAVDIADPKQTNITKKIWHNLLKYYVQTRQMAQSALQDMQSVTDFCWASGRYLAAIERVSRRAQTIWDNLKNWKAENPIDAIIYTEEKIFQNSDLLLYVDIPKWKEEQQKLQEARDALRSRYNNRLDQLQSILPDPARFETRYRKLIQINSPSAFLLNDANDPNVRFHTTVLSQAARVSASAPVTNDYLDGQSSLLESAISNATNAGQVDPLHQAEFSKLQERNQLLLTYQNANALTEAVKIEALLLLTITRRNALKLQQKEAAFIAIEQFSDALR
jgi:hypothetical protein